MRLSAHQPCYLPWAGLFQKIHLADTFVFFNQVQYVKKDWLNRNLVKGPNGVVWLTVPVRTSSGSRIAIKDVRIDNSQLWQRKHWRTLESCYSKAPFFDEVSSILEPIIRKEKWDLLVELNQTLILEICRFLGVTAEFLDARNFVWEGNKSDLVLSMCKNLGATSYLFGSQGRDYADVESFRLARISPKFQEYSPQKYPQLWGAFTPNLSVVDLMFNCGSDAFQLVSGVE